MFVLPEIRRGNPKKTILAFHAACDTSLGALYDELPRDLWDPRWHTRKHVEEKIIVNIEMTTNENIKSNAWKSIIRFYLIYKTLFYLSHAYGKAEIVQNVWIVKRLLRSMCNGKKIASFKVLVKENMEIKITIKMLKCKWQFSKIKFKMARESTRRNDWKCCVFCVGDNACVRMHI